MSTTGQGLAVTDGGLRAEGMCFRGPIPTIGYLVAALLFSNRAPAQGKFEPEFIFDAALESHGHVHASCIIEGPNGELRAVWHENGTRL